MISESVCVVVAVIISYFAYKIKELEMKIERLEKIILNNSISERVARIEEKLDILCKLIDNRKL